MFIELDINKTGTKLMTKGFSPSVTLSLVTKQLFC